jgi:hypothetical protein
MALDAILKILARGVIKHVRAGRLPLAMKTLKAMHQVLGLKKRAALVRSLNALKRAESAYPTPVAQVVIPPLPLTEEQKLLGVMNHPQQPLDKGRPPLSNADVLEFGINAYDKDLHDQLYANRELEAVATLGAVGLPFVTNVTGKIRGSKPILSRMGQGVLGVGAMGAKAHFNNSDVVSQQALKWLLLKNERAASHLNAIATRWHLNEMTERDAKNQASDESWNAVEKTTGVSPPALTSEEAYNRNMDGRYFRALLGTLKNKPNVITPELNSPLGQAMSIALVGSPYLSSAGLPTRMSLPGAAGSGVAFGINGVRAANAVTGASDRVEQLKDYRYAPDSPTSSSYFWNGLNAHVDEDVIQHIPANEWPAYLKQNDRNKGIAYRIYGDNEVKNDRLLPSAHRGKAVYEIETPHYGYVTKKYVHEDDMGFHPVRKSKEFLNNFGEEASKNYSESGLISLLDKLSPYLKDTKEYEKLKLRTKYPSFGSK